MLIYIIIHRSIITPKKALKQILQMIDIDTIFKEFSIKYVKTLNANWTNKCEENNPETVEVKIKCCGHHN